MAGEPSYIELGVPDPDAALTRVTSQGGSVVGQPQDAPGFGRFAECADDQGVRFGLREVVD